MIASWQLHAKRTALTRFCVRIVFGARSALSFSQLLSQVLQPVLPPGRGRTSYWIRQQAATFCAFLIPVPKQGLRGDLQVPLQVPRAASPRAIASPKTDVGGDILLSASGAGDRSLAAATTGCVGTSPLNAVRCFAATSTTRRFRGSFGGIRMMSTGDFSCTTVGPVACDRPATWLTWLRDGFFPALATRACLRRLRFNCLPTAD
jgi:hypothetical protein